MKQFALVLFLLMLMLVGCGPAGGASGSSTSVQPSSLAEAGESAVNPTTPVDDGPIIRLAALKGPTTMGLVRLIEDAEERIGQNQYDVTIGTTDETVPLLGKGEVDIAAVPANLASVLYHNTNGGYRVLAINTLGVLYAVEKGETVQSAEDLRGKTVYSIGKGAVPEFAVNHVLSANGIDPAADLTLEYKSEAAEIIPLLLQSENGIAILQQPFVTTALDKVEGLRVALDWTEEWDKVSGEDSALVTGVMIVRTEFLERYPDAVKTFLREYAASTAYTNEHPEEAGLLVEKHGIAAADIAARAIPACNIVCITGEEMKASLSGYLNVLFQQNPQSVGGNLPEEEFYYLG